MLDQLLEDSRLYRRGSEYQNLLDFVVRLRNFAPFNALLLQIQKPGLHHAASAHDWLATFNRTVKQGARPLLILWPFGPVALVYDLMDTDGDQVPLGVTAFYASGKMDQASITKFERSLLKKGIMCTKIDAGDRNAGSIVISSRPINRSERSTYELTLNKNHDANVQFSTLAHELAHLFLGHLGPDHHLHVPARPSLAHSQLELEAESTAYIVCARNGVECKSQSYLAAYVKQDTTLEQIDLYQVMRAAGQIENVLRLAAHAKMGRPVKKFVTNLPLFPEHNLLSSDLFDTYG
jgi:hypothetical protein